MVETAQLVVDSAILLVTLFQFYLIFKMEDNIDEIEENTDHQ
jgi:hypothetical protein